MPGQKKYRDWSWAIWIGLIITGQILINLDKILAVYTKATSPPEPSSRIVYPPMSSLRSYKEFQKNCPLPPLPKFEKYRCSNDGVYSPLFSPLLFPDKKPTTQTIPNTKYLTPRP